MKSNDSCCSKSCLSALLRISTRTMENALGPVETMQETQTLGCQQSWWVFQARFLRPQLRKQDARLRCKMKPSHGHQGDPAILLPVSTSGAPGPGGSWTINHLLKLHVHEWLKKKNNVSLISKCLSNLWTSLPAYRVILENVKEASASVFKDHQQSANEVGNSALGHQEKRKDSHLKLNEENKAVDTKWQFTAFISQQSGCCLSSCWHETMTRLLRSTAIILVLCVSFSERRKKLFPLLCVFISLGLSLFRRESASDCLFTGCDNFWVEAKWEEYHT